MYLIAKRNLIIAKISHALGIALSDRLTHTVVLAKDVSVP
jgi:hypothetical protein